MNSPEFSIQANIVDLLANRIFFGELITNSDKTLTIKELGIEKPLATYLIPGFVDAHVHVESSLLTPTQFARLAVLHGTVGTISDPHEIANVLGIDGVHYMIENGRQVPFHFCFGAPSCVPATAFETAGAALPPADVETLLAMPEIGYLAEMMNFPGVLHKDEEVWAKLALAKKYQKPVDGHAPGLRGKQAAEYIAAGISTDHECFQREEAAEKLALGMKILIREGSAAKNFDELIPLAKQHSSEMMFCSDDKHPDSLLAGHINQLIKRAVAAGVSILDALRMASLNPIRHYKLGIGLLQNGDPADLVEVDNLTDLNILRTFIKGQLVAERGESFIENLPSRIVNNFDCHPVQATDLAHPAISGLLPVIGVLNGQLITEKLWVEPTKSSPPPREETGEDLSSPPPREETGEDLSSPPPREETGEDLSSPPPREGAGGGLSSPPPREGAGGGSTEPIADVTKDLAKLVVVNRYRPAKPAVAFIKGFGLQGGALASSVAHDSHNIIAVGMDDESLARAINLIISEKGGLSAVFEDGEQLLPLPVAGIMSHADAYEVAAAYTAIDAFSKEVMGSSLTSPFMALSFMALLVIPSLKLSDLGLFDGDSFEFVSY